jgi:hypothetical protein
MFLALIHHPLQFITPLHCEISLEELFHVAVEVNPAVMNFLVACRAEYPDIVQCVGPAILDGLDVVDLKVLVVAKSVYRP